MTSEDIGKEDLTIPKFEIVFKRGWYPNLSFKKKILSGDTMKKKIFLGAWIFFQKSLPLGRFNANG